MNQLSFDDFLDGGKELIHCQLSSEFHWLRITSGYTPSLVKSRVHFSLHGYDYFYEDTKGKDEILNLFNGPIKTVSWETAMAGHDIEDGMKT
ncbi:ATP synthase epsilon chain 2 [Bacillus sp. OxB-1]|uniref:hypothetical protein n=1 Tax=Bacillus sp. (strain OxB-1) TaxID=98228 RepID=UPI000581B71E|nr:hypothetical protein [Bacillus sp. OxB-1]BAQ11472.1 ATP synthase epsilon chain 2 [Bacillus sp. OxB-1]